MEKFIRKKKIKGQVATDTESQSIKLIAQIQDFTGHLAWRKYGIEPVNS